MILPEWVHRSFRLPYRLHITTYGKKGPRLIFLHGIASHGRIWNDIVKHLARDYRCIVIDLLGHGQSPKPHRIRYDIDIHCRSIRWTLKWYGLTGRATFVGHSMGALIATHYAARHGWQVRGLLLIGMPIYLKRNMIEKPKLLEGFLDQSYLGFYRILRSLNSSQAVKVTQFLLKTSPSLIGQINMTEKTWYPFVSSLAYTIEQQSVASDLARIRASLPITVMYGSLDELVIASNIKKAFAQRKNTKIVRMSTRHELNPTAVRTITRQIYELVPPS